MGEWLIAVTVSTSGTARSVHALRSVTVGRLRLSAYLIWQHLTRLLLSQARQSENTQRSCVYSDAAPTLHAFSQITHHFTSYLDQFISTPALLTENAQVSQAPHGAILLKMQIQFRDSALISPPLVCVLSHIAKCAQRITQHTHGQK